MESGGFAGVVVILDELGFVPFDRHGGELLFNAIADRYERRSVVVTTNPGAAREVGDDGGVNAVGGARPVLVARSPPGPLSGRSAPA